MRSPEVKFPTQDLLDEGPSAAEVLADLRTAKGDPERLRRAVIDAESLDFDAGDTLELIDLLWEFIAAHRQSTEPIDITVVGSAIRTLIAISPIDTLGQVVADLLNDAALPSLRMEITVAKMIRRKLATNPAAFRDRNDLLKHVLWHLVAKYLDAATIETRGHGAVAMDTILALALVEPPDFSVILDRIRSFDARWFRQMIAREAMSLAKDLGESPCQASCPRTIQSLKDIARAAVPTVAE